MKMNKKEGLVYLQGYLEDGQFSFARKVKIFLTDEEIEDYVITHDEL